MRQGKPMASQSEVDEIAPCQVTESVDAAELEHVGSEELSELHDD